MKKANITVAFDEDKLGALEFSLKKEGSSVQARLEQTHSAIRSSRSPELSISCICTSSPVSTSRMACFVSGGAASVRLASATLFFGQVVSSVCPLSTEPHQFPSHRVPAVLW